MEKAVSKVVTNKADPGHNRITCLSITDRIAIMSAEPTCTQKERPGKTHGHRTPSSRCTESQTIQHISAPKKKEHTSCGGERIVNAHKTRHSTNVRDNPEYCVADQLTLEKPTLLETLRIPCGTQMKRNNLHHCGKHWIAGGEHLPGEIATGCLPRHIRRLPLMQWVI